MFKCTGVCSTCGRCKNSAMMSGANDRKTKILTYPADFAPDKGEGYGIAIDIGTTTVVGMLWDLEKGKQAAACARTNPQNEFGMDVISRITYCIQNTDGQQILHEKISGCISEVTDELCRQAGIDRADVKKMTVGGNTTMSHLYLNKDPKGLAVAPFAPAYTGIAADHSDDCEITVVPNIAGHVGGDITAGLLATRLLDKKDLTLFIDIGTNGEIALTDGSRTLTCSAAAGPAFEGASIYQGMRAATGAIEKVWIDEHGEVFFKTIGECEPTGICGSGLIDAVAEMLKCGAVNKRGRIIASGDVEKKGLAAGLKDRLIEVDGQRRFILVPKANGKDIVITQNDIREVQLAKGAIAAGIKLMLEELGRQEDDLEQILIAGAFGNYIDIASAAAIGVLPDINQERVVAAGNTAGAGVSMALVSSREMTAMELIPERVEHIELAERENFQDVYIKSMNFK